MTNTARDLKHFCLPLLFSAGMLAGCHSDLNTASAQTSGGTLVSPPITMNADFQARNPRTCSAVNHKPSVAEATVLVQCDLESVSAHTLYLSSDVQVQMGGGRPYNVRMDTYFENADTRGTIYPIRGTFKKYTCDTPSVMTPNRNTCTTTLNTHPEGACWKTTFGDWKCHLGSTEMPASTLGPPPATY